MDRAGESWACLLAMGATLGSAPTAMYCIQSFTSSIITFTTLSTAMMITSHAVASSSQVDLAIFASFQQSLLQQAKHCRGQIRKLFDSLTVVGEQVGDTLVPNSETINFKSQF